MKKFIGLIFAALLLSSCSESQNQASFAYAPLSARVEIREGPSQAELDVPTQVVVLGTGTPISDAYRAGPSIAVIHRGQSYIFDIGSGAVRRAVEARYKHNIPSLYPSAVRAVFITHMHSDHVIDLPELAYTLWWHRPVKLRAFGPIGLQSMADNMTKMMAADIKIRTNGIQPLDSPEGYEVDVTEIKPGIIFEEDGMTVEAFSVPHGDIKPAFGFKIVTDDLSVVISGDTSASKIIREKARNVDLLFHEVISDEGLATNPKIWQDYHLSAHTRGSDVGKIAADAKPKKLIFYHGIYYGTKEENLIRDASKYFSGEIILAKDLDIFRADDD